MGVRNLMVGRTKQRTKSDEARLEVIREIGCICCAIDGWADVPCEIHHLLIGGQRHDDEHRYTIGLDAWHHRGKCSGTVEATTESHGPSLAHTPRAFRERYGTDDELLIVQDSAIRIVEGAHRRGEYLPGEEMARLIRMLHREVVYHRSPHPRAVRAR